MPKNVNAVQSGLVQENDVNNPSVDHMRGRNLFPQSFMHPSTCRYGEVDPVMSFKCERGDILPYKFVTDLNTFTLASPLKSEVSMYTAAFKVPMQALYPRNWDIMQPFPTKGDDVPDDCRALFPVITFLNVLTQGVTQSLADGYANGYIRNTLLQEYVLSAGSLFSKFNYHFDSLKRPVVVGSATVGEFVMDEFIDNYFAPWLKAELTDTDVIISHIDNETPDYTVTSDRNLIGQKYAPNTFYISFRRALELLRTGEYLVDDSVGLATAPSFKVFGNSIAINIEPIVAYNSACSHFFNNPKIDYIYSWELYRDNMQSLVYGNQAIPTFIWNGVLKQYDVFSQRIMTETFEALSDPNDSRYLNHSSFWFNFLGFHRSLRFGDYFTGVHPEPLAVGDINAPVVDGSVNAIEMTQKLQLTRLLNKVNIAGPRKDDQLVALYGGPLPDAPKDVPVRLSAEKFTVSGFEVNNTGELQAQSIEDSSSNITTTNLRLTDSKFMFEVPIDEPCWIIAVQYYEAHRIYTKTCDRFAFHRDRLDDFQPDMQYVGDQDINQMEINAVEGNEDIPFAYNLRNMEYKQRYSYASGGFVRHLPSWLFITDNNDGNPAPGHITPDYIRSSPSEFDRFYKSLMGYSLASYFHFITTNTNVLAPYRQMVYAPEILA